MELNDLCDSDLNKIAEFNRICKNYIKLGKIMNITKPKSKTHKLCHLIEKCGASEKLTKASELAIEIDDWYQSIKTSIHKKGGWLYVRLTIGNQHFDLDFKTKSKHEAEWVKDVIDKALEIK